MLQAMHKPINASTGVARMVIYSIQSWNHPDFTANDTQAQPVARNCCIRLAAQYCQALDDPSAICKQAVNTQYHLIHRKSVLFFNHNGLTVAYGCSAEDVLLKLETKSDRGGQQMPVHVFIGPVVSCNIMCHVSAGVRRDNEHF